MQGGALEGRERFEGEGLRHGLGYGEGEEVGGAPEEGGEVGNGDAGVFEGERGEDFAVLRLLEITGQAQGGE